MSAKPLPLETHASSGSTAASRLSRWLPLLAIFVAGIALRNFVVANTYVSWLITLCEKALNGERPYVDYIEVNPPASIWLYMTPVWLARVLGMRPEFMVDAFVFAAAIASLAVSAAILRGGTFLSRQAMFQLAAAFAAVLLLLPAQNFGEREHIALMTFLPFLAVAAVRAKALAPSLFFVLAAGLGAGVTAIIKPHFVFPVILVSAVAALKVKDWRVFFAFENWIAAVLLAAYAAAVYVFYPEFVAHTLPLVAEIYVPARAEIWPFLLQVATPMLALVLVTTWRLKGKAALQPPFSLLLAACIGFSISYYVQLKGWSYHAYPMLALAFVAAAVAFMERWPLTPNHSESVDVWAKGIVPAFSIVLLAGATFVWMTVAVDAPHLRGDRKICAASDRDRNYVGHRTGPSAHPRTRRQMGWSCL